MHNLMSSIPYPLLVVGFIAIDIYAIIEFVKLRKKDYDNPKRYFNIVFLFISPAVLLYYYRESCLVSSSFSAFISIYSIAAIIVMICSVFIIGYFSFKRGYGDFKGFKKALPAMICGVIFIIACLIYLEVSSR